MNRYSLNWAMYLGHHHAYRREIGEAQLTFNWVQAFTDYMINFTFGKGVQFRSPKETEAIVPDVLKRVWEIDNPGKVVLWEIGQQGGVSGDAFVKVAYEEGWIDSTGREHPGRVRVLPLNSAFSFPEFHPHDRTRLIRFKLKYRFWGTSSEGTRQVFTYVEILTDDMIEEYINDELIDQRPNPLGIIPIVHIPNTFVSGSPWGLGDCHNVTDLNRQYNETATDVADIINYHAAPVTVVIGAKPNQLEKGAQKVWGLPREASVQNLEGGWQGLQGAMEFLELIKRSMHEMTGIPETALGQVQPISNTSGVALQIQFQPLMNKYQQKIIQYSVGLERINELVILTLFLKEPEQLVWDPNSDVPLQEGQWSELDPMDPISYRSIIHFPPPLPLDKLVILNEIQTEMAMGLESREGGLRKLGEEFPDEKLAEIRKELMDDALNDGALNLVRAQINAAIQQLTGIIPGPDGSGQPVPQDYGPDGEVLPGAVPQQTAENNVFMAMGQQEVEGLMETLNTLAYGTKLAQRRNPDSDND